MSIILLKIWTFLKTIKAVTWLSVIKIAFLIFIGIAIASIGKGCNKASVVSGSKIDTVKIAGKAPPAVHDTIYTVRWHIDTLWHDSGHTSVPTKEYCSTIDTTTPHGTHFMMVSCYLEMPKLESTTIAVQEPPDTTKWIFDTVTVIQKEPYKWFSVNAGLQAGYNPVSKYYAGIGVSVGVTVKRF